MSNEVVHYFCPTNGDPIQVDDCAAARRMAVEHGWAKENPESAGWSWIEVQNYDRDKAVAAHEWVHLCPKEDADE